MRVRMSKLLYHWSPTQRRSSIRRRGLVPGSPSTDRLWYPPYVCFADSPSLAWALSGSTQRGQEHLFWDLWMMWSNVPTRMKVIRYDEPPHQIKEYRVPERI